MRKLLAVASAAVVIAALGVAVVAGVAVAQAPPAGQPATAFNFAQQMREALARALNITPEQLTTAIGTARDQVLKAAIEQGKLTQEQADKMKERAQNKPDWDFDFGPLRGKARPGMAFKGGFSLGVVSDKLGMTPQELSTALKGGKTITDLAKEKNVDPQAIADALIKPESDRLAKAVADGKITQTQADQMLTRAKENVQNLLTRQWTAPEGRGLRQGLPGLGKVQPKGSGAFSPFFGGGSV